MERIAVKSSLLKAIAYDPEKQVLEVEFLPNKEGDCGKVYQYTGFPLEAWQAWSKAESIGKHFLKEIKPKYECKKIEPEKSTDEKAQEAPPQPSEV